MLSASILPILNSNSSSMTLDDDNNNNSLSKKNKSFSSSSSSSTKRKRADTPSDSPAKNGCKKKKASRACVHCQKAHLTCDDSRPCQRCVKRGMANNCVEGHRKKAKYLLDDEELEALKREKPAGKSTTKLAHDPKPKQETPQPQPDQSHIQPPVSILPESLPAISTTSLPTSEPFMSPASPMFPFTTATYTSPFDPNSSYNLSPNFNTFSSSFGSEAANLEYSILSAILGNNGSPDSGNEPTPSTSTDPTQTASTNFGTPGWAKSAEFPPDGSSEQPLNDMSGMSPSSLLPYSIPPRAGSPNQLLKFATPYARTTASSFQRDYQTQPGTATTSPGHSIASLPGTSTSDDDSTSHGGLGSKRKPSLYDSVTKSYDYTEGYHFLMKFLVARFEKNDILRVVRALSIFRPSLIALQMPLAEEDEVFVEKCFQRSLIELEKLISFSGTPTVAWRRTGEICLVGDEFCMLTGWTKEELLSGSTSTTGGSEDVAPRKKFIYELFENQSVVEYWENFATHAFENTTQSVFSHCVLLKPSGAPVPCTFCFSIRRDLWDLPSLCVGQWLPLL